MSYLIGDIGNTEIKLCILNMHYKIVNRLNLKTSKVSNKIYLKKNFFSFIQNKKISKKAFFTSVVPSVFLNISKNLKKNFKIQCLELKKTNYTKLIKLEVNKKQIGSDRIANAIGALYKYKVNCIVLDFGTATTFDVINKGVYKGGVIAPGVNISLNTLVKKADQIPTFKISKVRKVIGNNTISALKSGFYWGYIGLIQNILELIKKESKKNYKIILTGGFSLLFKNIIKSTVVVDKDITMNGLIEVLKINKPKDNL